MWPCLFSLNASKRWKGDESSNLILLSQVSAHKIFASAFCSTV